MTDHDQNEAALTLAGMISTSRPFAELHPSAAVPIAAQIVDAIRAGKVPGINSQATTDTVCNSLRNHLVVKHNNEIAALRAERDEAIERRDWWFARSEEHKDAGYKELMKRQAAEVDNERLRGLLKESRDFTRHTLFCQEKMEYADVPCTCGLEQHRGRVHQELGQ